MSKIYIPDLEASNCVVIRSSDVIRVYDTSPTLNSEVHYKDYYPRLNYNYNEGYQTFGNYYSNLPICREASSDVKYHPDFASSLPIIIVIVILSVILINNLLDEVF